MPRKQRFAPNIDRLDMDALLKRKSELEAELAEAQTDKRRRVAQAKINTIERRSKVCSAATNVAPPAQQPASEVVDTMAQEAEDRAHVITAISGAARSADIVERLKSVIADERNNETATAAISEFVRFALQVYDVPVDVFVSRIAGPLIVNACYNAEGSTYELATASRIDLERRFPGRPRINPRVFVAGANPDVRRLADREFVRPLVALLAGLPVEVVAELLPVEFRDAVFDEPL